MMHQSFYDEGAQIALTKLGFDPPAANKVLQVVKQKTLPRRAMEEVASARAAGGFIPDQLIRRMARQQGPAASQGPKASAAFARARKPDITPEELDKIRRDTNITGVFRTPRGDAARFLRQSGGSVPEFTPEQHKMFDAVVKGHELDELQLQTPSHVTAAWGHMSPEVLFREHNKIVTMPPDMDPVRRTVQGMRQSSGESAVLNEHLRPFGFTFGEGDRLSPSMREAMRQHLEQALPDVGTAGAARGAAQKLEDERAYRAAYQMDPGDTNRLFEQVQHDAGPMLGSSVEGYVKELGRLGDALKRRRAEVLRAGGAELPPFVPPKRKYVMPRGVE